jgi:hypothetical protein
MYTGKTQRTHISHGCWWPRCAIEGVRLSAAAGSALVPNAERPKGLQVWNHNLLSRVWATDYGDPGEPLRAIRICGVRSGAFSAKVLVGSTAPIRLVQATATDLKGAVAIPASAIQIRYALPDGHRRYSREHHWFDSLAETPPAEVPLDERAKAALQPIWLTIHVPRDAKPGSYQGKVTVAAEAATPVEIPLHLKVIDWTLPDPKEFLTHVGLIQSPETLALYYKAPMWSDTHWKLIDRSFELLGQVGTKVVYITLVRRIHFGNPHSVVRWVRQPDGSLKADVSIAAKYLDVAVKHLGRIPVVGLYCWEPLHTGHYEHKKFHGDRDILISIVDPRTGELAEGKGPKWGTPECPAFWREAIDAVKAILRKHDIEKSAMIGIAADYAPSKTVVDDLAAAAPGTKWIAMSHVFWSKVHDQPVGYLVVLWGMYGLWDPAYETFGERRFHGWRTAPFLITRFPRDELRLPSATLGRYRTFPETWMVGRGKWMQFGGETRKRWSGTRGFGRLGADFWPVVRDVRGRLRNITGRYPAESSWGQLTLNYSWPAILGPGKDGPLATGRLEMLRGGLQEVEARIFIERALLDPAKRAKLGDDLADRCQAILDERVRNFIRAIGGKRSDDWFWFVSSGWRARSEELYAAAAQVAARLKGN